MDEPVATTEKSKKIEAINKETIHHICSGQVVLDLAIAVKELVENSLDSGATVIDVKLTDYGKTCISVSDNGSGVSEQDFEGLGLKHHTSKLREFTDLTEVDLTEVNTFGFRGEALSSLCALSELSIITRHATSEHGFKLEFDRNGILTRKEPYAREKGTTVYVRNIFKNLPVRAKEFQKNLKKEYARAVQVLYSYCLVSTNIKITCSNLLAGKSPNLIVTTRNVDDVLSNINSVFGKKSLDGIVKLELQSPDETVLQEYNLPSDATVDFDWECYVSTCDHAIGRSSPDRQFFYVNGRPCDLTKISKLVNSVYHRYNIKQYPFVFFNIKLDRQCADVNVTPDKRTIFVTQERLILATLKFSLITKWDKLQGNFTVKTLTELNFGLKRTISPNHAHSPAKRLQLSPSVSHIVKENDTTIQTNIKSLKKPTDVNMAISIVTIKEKLNEKQNIATALSSTIKRIKYRVQMEGNQSEAEKELQKELTKDSFEKMEIIGQFNLGFIIARLEDDLFIIDQHATDEKFRFEKLSNETKLKTQKLIVPKLLNFSALNETILIDNLQTFENNGFTFNINEQAEPGKKVELIGMPVSGNWQFGQEDIEELIFLIREAGNENKHMYRPSRVRQMLASRACRSAVMIGTALNTSEMQRLVTQMTQMYNPWNCPHGRPTIRHLLSLLLVNK
ncbi:mismatch repair endonuclease PMS2 [Solenopsis invicta]|uniref:mismatch repair endonuclease PMS2 n=1 Tax=Solenopsis invicta TaxID=13686 RepID=UPI00193DAEE2|nr:mismatch repair endonuclease PMS2 [Solenopsis invicta]